MGQVVRRKICSVGPGSFFVTIPKGWLAFHGLKLGDEVEVVSNGKLSIRPAKREGDEHGK